MIARSGLWKCLNHPTQRCTGVEGDVTYNRTIGDIIQMSVLIVVDGRCRPDCVVGSFEAC